MESRDHVPARVLLDEPHPANMPWVWACLECNRGPSIDEEYLACLIDCTLAGSTSHLDVARTKVRRILKRKPLLASRLQSAKVTTDTNTIFHVEEDRVRRVIVKLARGHSLFELNEPVHYDPTYSVIKPLMEFMPTDRVCFESVMSSSGWPEVGSRAMQRLIGVGEEGALPSGEFGWIHVQPGRYRYQAHGSGDVVVRIVLSEYLGAEVAWLVEGGDLRSQLEDEGLPYSTSLK